MLNNNKKVKYVFGPLIFS